MEGQGAAGIGIALSGGAARGIAHAGVLEVLAEEGIAVRAVAGTSAGSIVGALFAAGVAPAAIARLALETRWTDFFAPRLPRGGLLAGGGLARFLERVLPARTFAELRLPFVAVAADLETGARVDLAAGDLPRAVLASCSVPIVFEPVRHEGRLLVDGGIASQLPVRALRGLAGALPAVAVDVNAGAPAAARFDSAPLVAVHLAQLWTDERARAEAGLADAVVAVAARDVALHDLSRGEELLRRGRAAARAALPALRALPGRR